MRKAMVFAAALASVTVFLGRAAAEEPGLRPIQEAFGLGQKAIQQVKDEQELRKIEPPAAEQAPEPLFHTESLDSLPPPDAKTLAWLASRIPGLDVKNVKSVPLDVADSVMQRAVAAKATYLDLFTNDAFRKGDAYYISQDVLNTLHKKYISGSLPVQANDENGKPFQMQAMVIGQNRAEMLFDRSEFVFKDAKNKFKIQNGGRVESGIQGPGDVSIDGLSAYGAPIICPWAKIKRMTKESMYKIKVETSCGSRGGNDIREIRLR